MIERGQAQLRAEEHLGEMLKGCSDPTISLQVSRIEEHEFGWLFYYVASRRLTAGLKPLPVAGNAPFIVERDSGRVLVLGTAYPVDHYLANYARTGDPHGEPGDTVILVAANPGAKKIDAVKSIRDHTGLGLSEAKHCIDQCLDGKVVELKTTDASAARELVKELREQFFAAEQKNKKKRTALQP